MYVEVTFSHTQYIPTKSLMVGTKRAKRNLKKQIGDKLYRDLITGVDARLVPDSEMVPAKQSI